MENFNALNWVERITGMKETDFRYQKQKYLKSRKSNYTTDEMIIVNSKTNEEFSCGCLEMIPLKDLRTHYQKGKKSCIFEIIIVGDSESQDEVNVATMQAMKKYDNSVFLVASNFNAVESVSERISPDSEDFTTDYIFDKTQGPVASLGAPAAALQRTIFPFYDKSIHHFDWEQGQKKQIKMLKDFDDTYHMMNGYPMLNEDSREPSMDESEKFLSVIHSNVEVSFIFKNSMYVVPEKERNRIDQVFAAACNIGQGKSGHKNNVCSQQKRNIIKLPLYCGYETCYLTAMKNKRKNIILTLLGGGVFGNSIGDIMNAICEVHKKYGMKNDGTLEKVILPLFSINGGLHLFTIKNILEKHKIPFVITIYKNKKIVESKKC